MRSHALIRLTHPLALVVLLLSIPRWSSAETVIRIAADQWCPYNCGMYDQHQGFLVDIARLAFESSEQKVVYRVMPWSEALKDAETGKIDIAIGAVTAHHGKNILNRIPLGRDRSVLVTLKNSEFQYNNAQALRGLMLGVVNGYTYDGNGPVDQYLASAEARTRVLVLHRENAIELLLKLLDAQRIDGFLENQYVAIEALTKAGLTERARLQQLNEGDTIHFAFTPSDMGRARAKQFDEALLKLDAQGDIKRVMDKYGLPYVALKAPSN